MLQHRPELHRGATQGLVCRGLPLVTRHEEMATGITEATLARGLEAHVPVLEDGELLGEQLRNGDDVALDVGDHAHADLVGDLAQGVDVLTSGLEPQRLPGKRRDALRTALDGQIVDARLIDEFAQGAHEGVARAHQLRVQLGVVRDRAVDGLGSHGPCILSPELTA